MQKVCKELIDFFEQGNGWDKEEILSEMTHRALQKLSHINYSDDVYIPADEVDLCWNDDVFSFTLEDFAQELFAEMIKGVCSVIRTV